MKPTREIQWKKSQAWTYQINTRRIHNKNKMFPFAQGPRGQFQSWRGWPVFNHVVITNFHFWPICNIRGPFFKCRCFCCQETTLDRRHCKFKCKKRKTCHKCLSKRIINRTVRVKHLTDILSNTLIRSAGRRYSLTSTNCLISSDVQWRCWLSTWTKGEVVIIIIRTHLCNRTSILDCLLPTFCHHRQLREKGTEIRPVVLVSASVPTFVVNLVSIPQTHVSEGKGRELFAIGRQIKINARVSCGVALHLQWDVSASVRHPVLERKKKRTCQN